MHGLPNDETDLMKMGGLAKPMPVTALTWTVSAAAMAGIPPLSGFFSKDQVISSASLAGRPGFWVAALVGAFLTAVYMGRGTFLAFFGSPRYEGHPHDPPAPMRLVLLALGALAVIGGVLGLSAGNGLLVRFLRPVIGPVGERVAGPSEAVLTLISVVVALLGVGLAAFVYVSGRFDWQALRARFAGARRSLSHGFYVNDVYGGAIVSPAKAGSAFLAYVVDDRLIDGSVNGIGGAFRQLARAGRLAQSGLVRRYALAFAAGAVGILIFVAVRS
jgi:NADH-quinone oxidoreductase subunit L